jgi:quercetin dioxygenase-like cupin family protein
MARKHIEFVDTSTLSWQPASLPGMSEDAREKILSEDDETGAVTLMLELPAHWQRITPGYHNAPVEIFVLRGDLTINATELINGCYSYIPAGMVHSLLESKTGCLALLMFESRPDFVESTVSRSDSKSEQYIACINTSEMPWSSARLEGPPAGILVKPLRSDPLTHDWTWISAVLPLWRENRAEVHPTVEEAFMLQGDTLLGERGIMIAGCYFWRPPNVPHGPMLSKTGGMWFFRTKGGNLEVTYTNPPRWEQLVNDYLYSGPLFAFTEQGR